MGNPEAFVVLNADIMGDYPLQEFVEFHKQHVGEHSILATEARIFFFMFLLVNSEISLYMLYTQRTPSDWSSCLS